MPQVSDYTALITSEHAPRPKYMAMVAAVAQCFVNQQTTLNGMPTAFDVDVAIGVQLDAVGLWVGIPRQIKVPVVGVYFAWDTANVGWDQGIWFQQGAPTGSVDTLDDETYRLLIRAKIGANKWNGSAQDSVAILNSIFTPAGLSPTLTDNQDMTMSLTLAGDSISALTQALVTQGYIPVRPVGVNLSAVTFVRRLRLNGLWALDGSQTLNGIKV